jgi:iron complex transport system substrate-binding protein
MRPLPITRRASLAAPFLLAGRARAENFTDDAGRSVALPATIRKVFAAGPPASIILFALAPEKLAGWTTAWRDQEAAFVEPRWAGLPVTGRVTGRGGSANMEDVLRAAPDLILDYGSVSQTYVSLADRVQAQTGIPVLLLDGQFDRIAASFRRLGQAVGVAARGQALAADAEARLALTDARVAAVPHGQRPRVYYGRNPDGLTTGLAGSINVETLARAGGRNVADAAGSGGLTQVSLEQVLGWDPEVIVTTDPRFFGSVRRDPLWRGVAALRSGRVHLSPPGPFGWIDFPPATNRLLGVEWLARVLYPERFPDPFGPRIESFFAGHYHRAPDAAQLAAMLRTLDRLV